MSISMARAMVVLPIPPAPHDRNEPPCRQLIAQSVDRAGATHNQRFQDRQIVRRRWNLPDQRRRPFRLGHPDRRSETIAASGNIGQEAAPRLTIAQGPAKPGYVYSERILVDEGVRPDARDELLLADDLTSLFDQCRQDVERTAA